MTWCVWRPGLVGRLQLQLWRIKPWAQGPEATEQQGPVEILICLKVNPMPSSFCPAVPSRAQALEGPYWAVGGLPAQLSPRVSLPPATLCAGEAATWDSWFSRFPGFCPVRVWQAGFATKLRICFRVLSSLHHLQSLSHLSPGSLAISHLESGTQTHSLKSLPMS